MRRAIACFSPGLEVNRLDVTCLDFNAKGRAEVARLMFAIAGIQYVDDRVAWDDWKNQKSRMPWGQVPVLTVDGKTQIAQSIAINYYVASVTGLNGDNALDAALIQSVAGAVLDVTTPFNAARFNKNEEEKKAQLEAFWKDTAPVWWANFAKNLGDRQYFVGNKLSLADILFYYIMDVYFLPAKPDAIKEHQNLVSLYERVKGHPKVDAWVKARPVTTL